MKLTRGQRVRNFLNRITDNGLLGFQQAYGETHDVTRRALNDERAQRGLDEPLESVRALNKSQVIEALRDALTAAGAPGGYTDSMLMERTRQGMGIDPDPRFFDGISTARLVSDDAVERAEEELKLTRRADEYRKRMREKTPVGQRVGGSLGYLAGDITQDRTRGLYWLLNAVQATGRVVAETGMSLANPNLNTSRLIQGEALRRAEKQGLIRRIGNQPLKGEARKRSIQITDTQGKSPQDFADSLDDYGTYTGTKEDDLIYNNPANFEPSHPSMFTKGYGPNRKLYQRRINNNIIASAGLGATAYAINSGIGLLDRPDGFKAASPSDVDPREYDNAINEVATRYILGRPGRMDAELMEFERPDVSRQDRVKYQAYLYDKEFDVNPFDGDGVNIGGVIQTTGDGINGPEIRFLGRSLDMNTGMLPVGGAIGGLALGGLLPNVRQLRLRGQRPGALRFNPKQPLRTGYRKITNLIPEVKPKTWDKAEDKKGTIVELFPALDKPTEAIDDFFSRTNELTGQRDMDVMRTVGSLALGTIGGTAATTIAGEQLEDERRRRNFAKRFPGVDYDTYRKNAKDLLDKKYAFEKSDPNREQEIGKSRTGYNSRVRQQQLQEKALAQQTLIDQLVDQDLRAQAQKQMDIANWALDKANVIDQEIARRRAGAQQEEQPLTISF